MVQDLSEVHEPITELFPNFGDDCSQFQLSSDQLDFFHDKGYLAGVKVLERQQIDTLLTELEQIMDPDHPGNHLFHEFHSNESTDRHTVLFHALGGWRIAAAFHDLLWHPAIVVPASQLLGGAVRFWHDQLFCKPAKHGGVVSWHQDYSYWTRTKPMAHLTCWIGLDRSTRDNGCIHYVPGSHRWELLPVTGLAGDMESIKSVLDPATQDAFQPVAIELEPGECAFHHPLMVHGSYENKTSMQRRAAVLNFFKDGVRSDTQSPLLQGVPPVAPGEPVQGQFFPRLYSP